MPADFLVLPCQRNHARFSMMAINSCGCWVLAFLTINNMPKKYTLRRDKIFATSNTGNAVPKRSVSIKRYPWVLRPAGMREKKKKIIAHFDTVRRYGNIWKEASFVNIESTCWVGVSGRSILLEEIAEGFYKFMRITLTPDLSPL